MNLFDILSSGKKDLSEENVSSFLAWILDPNQSHGCGSLFLNRLLKIVTEEEQYLSLESVDVLVEEEVVIGEKRRFIDIVIEISSEHKKIIFAIENKIRESCEAEQLIEEYEGLRNREGNFDIYFLYLTPSKSAKFEKAFKRLPNNIIKSHSTWTNCNADEEKSIVTLFRNIIQDDLNAKINPLSNELKFVLKSFIVFAENGFRSQNSNKNSGAANGKTPYYKGRVSGIVGVRDLMEPQKVENIYIGFTGGEDALKNQSIEQLQNRPYKWNDNNDNIKQRKHWIPIKKFIEIIDTKMQIHQ